MKTFDPFAERAPTRSSAEDVDGKSHLGATWSPPEEGLLEQAWRLLRRRKWIILSALVIVPVIAFLYASHQPTQYTASAGLMFGDPAQSVLPSGSSSSQATVDPTAASATNTSLVSLPIVATYASNETGGKISAAEIHSSVSVSTGSTGSSIATIQAISGSPQRAAQIANAYGHGYIAFRRYSDQSAYAASISQIESEITKLTPSETSGPEGRDLSSELASLRNAQALSQGEAQLVQPANPPTSASSPKTSRDVILGVIIGLVLGLVLGALIDRLDRRISDRDEFERIYGLPVLGEIPRTRELGRGEVTFEVAERFRTLRTSLRYVNFNRRMHSLLVASPMPEDGKSTIARSLAETMAMMGDRVVLVELDLHGPIDNRDSGPGLSTVLIGDELEDALITQPLPNATGGEPRQLTVLPAGSTPPNPSELIDSERMRDVLAELERKFELVVLDAPAMARVSDGLSLVPVVSGILIVAGLGHTTTRAAMGLRQQIAILGGHPVGLVVNFTPHERHGRYYSYSYSH